MGKDLSKMTLEELWALFPIFLVPHDDRWKDSFNEIRQTLTGLLAAQPVVRISHIGSTAIQGIWAKNIVDVMIERYSTTIGTERFYRHVRRGKPDFT